MQDALNQIRASSDFTATETTSAIEVGPTGNNLVLEVRVGGAVTGTNPTLDVAILAGEDVDNADNQIAQIVTPITDATGPASDGQGTYHVPFSTELSHVAVTFTIGGTGAPTFPSMSAAIISGLRRQNLQLGDRATVIP